ncbi:peptidoglycan DD-metalloendopeptidase family protein [Bacillus pumilus]|uniref:murein hydrolase activator EnvC family protein n=1 Tax=Bacillus pumilus TaxID=1408 RepID=UPI00017A615B|nr:M23 family metallopeptidase [Bacillus pumilus]EDW22539.1 M23B subfamily peptidase [Bacillus pumilus ATCC 7061]MCR4352620.1 peptidoglycan DD-metalloendopeptidase family protein [Bacillus pumilus]MCY7504429.1 peptidoglycan DD-metalloendopeptidase family protein [Bacillus pumilus]MDR4268581.1 peptidoglycan DD-metalloendopeptidase family protein [Bacillus pumilus]MED4629722.1 peptidoglycan DD-metalloendopeptidase family protein [Bacillus pumilus]
MKRKLMMAGMAAFIGTTWLYIPGNENRAFAYEDLDQKRQQIEEKTSKTESTLKKKKSELAKLEKKESKLKKEIEKIDHKVSAATEKVAEKEKEVKQTKQEIKKLKKDIQVINDRIEKRKAIFKDRIRSMQKSGGTINYLDVLLGARSFSDFVGRVGAVTTIVEADKDMITEHENDLKLVEQKEAELNNQLSGLETSLKELEELKKDLSKQQKEKEKILGNVTDKKNHAHDELGKLENEQEILANQKAAVKSEEARRQKEEAKKAEQAAAEKSAPTPQSGGSDQVSDTPASSSGFIKPAAGRFSSGFGGRSGGNHYGLDIAAKGTVSVVAAASGTVTNSSYSSSYGNVIFITHNINGQTFQTVYAHLSTRSVSTGQRVEQGQFLGYMGNTGQSDGQHLHFEIHKGLWNGAKSNAVNPAQYIR